MIKDEELQLFGNKLKRLREGKHNPQRIIHEDKLGMCMDIAIEYRQRVHDWILQM